VVLGPEKVGSPKKRCEKCLYRKIFQNLLKKNHCARKTENYMKA
jgi:hypothetical protein